MGAADCDWEGYFRVELEEERIEREIAREWDRQSQQIQYEADVRAGRPLGLRPPLWLGDKA
jgi:hypothetical protein